jgi:hypothetical protein
VFQTTMSDLGGDKLGVSWNLPGSTTEEREGPTDARRTNEAT